MQLPVVPITIHGSFSVMPRTRDMKWVVFHPLTLTIHQPIAPIGQGVENAKYLEDISYETIMNGLPQQYQGFIANPDQ